MKTQLLPWAAIAAAAAAGPAFGQTVRPESLSYMSRTFRLNDVGRLEYPSYSRDGRWLAFDARSSEGPAQHIFVVAARGGTPVAITEGALNVSRPMWTAAGDRLVFFKAGEGGAVMTIAIDPATGRAVGAAKRVTVDSLRGEAFDVAPDGRTVAYSTPSGPAKFDLRLVPISGGPAASLPSRERPVAFGSTATAATSISSHGAPMRHRRKDSRCVKSGESRRRAGHRRQSSPFPKD